VAIWPDWVPPPTFAAHLGFAALLLLLTARLPETLAAPRGPWLSRPAFPPGTLATTLAILPGWGATATVLTTVQAAMAAEGRPLLGPLAACGMMIVGLAAQQIGRRMAPGRAVRLGLGVLVAGGGLTFWGVLGGGLVPLLAGAALVGTGTYAFVYPGGLSAVAEAASGEDRARAVAGYFVVAHVGFSAVPLAVGLAVDAFGTAAALFGAWLALAGSAAVLAVAVRR
jgi:MFS family permease